MALGQAELAGTFGQACGRLATGESCPSTWHAVVSITGTALLVIATALAGIVAVIVIGGFVYRMQGLLPARWAVAVCFSRELSLARFGLGPALLGDKGVGREIGTEPRPGGGLTAVTRRHETLAVDAPTADGLLKTLLRPLLGVAVSLGFWNRWSTAGFQIGRRQDWYQPQVAALEEAEATQTQTEGRFGSSSCAAGFAQQPAAPDHAASADLVSWKSMFRATIHSISLAWLLFPCGALPARACIYLNESVVFAVGDDGGGSADETDLLSHHFLEDSNPGAHILHWAAASAQLVVILCLLLLDYMGLRHEGRLVVCGGLLAAGLVLSVVRASLGLSLQLLAFDKRRALIRACQELVEAGMLARLVEERSRRSPLKTMAGATWLQREGFDDQGETSDGLRASGKNRLYGRGGEFDGGDLLAGFSGEGEAEVVVKACTELLELDWVRHSFNVSRNT
ncbi:unnamed protein product [Polarella glacialis]|uniref:Uncharacterized protein n=1 Tax=Polarella glacialis TaxID=89957 RepID=A0A813KWP5_POLGL|nr:unnamed protein product [Polarella glacialis]